MQINIDEKEKEFLIELLNEEHAELREEIYKAEEHDFKEELKRRKLLTEKLLEKLGSKEKFA
jgi:hypothetical protein